MKYRPPPSKPRTLPRPPRREHTLTPEIEVRVLEMLSMAGSIADPIALADYLDCDEVALVAFLRRHSSKAVAAKATPETARALARSIAEDTDTSPPTSDRAFSVADFENVQGISVMERRGTREVFSKRLKDHND